MSTQDEEIIAEFEEVAAAHGDAPEAPHEEDDVQEAEGEDDDSEED
jgi:hypothetical protein